MVQGKVQLCIGNYTTTLFPNKLKQLHFSIISIIIKNSFQINDA